MQMADLVTKGSCVGTLGLQVSCLHGHDLTSMVVAVGAWNSWVMLWPTHCVGCASATSCCVHCSMTLPHLTATVCCDNHQDLLSVNTYAAGTRLFYVQRFGSKRPSAQKLALYVRFSGAAQKLCLLTTCTHEHFCCMRRWLYTRKPKSRGSLRNVSPSGLWTG